MGATMKGWPLLLALLAGLGLDTAAPVIPPLAGVVVSDDLEDLEDPADEAVVLRKARLAPPVLPASPAARTAARAARRRPRPQPRPDARSLLRRRAAGPPARLPVVPAPASAEDH